MQETQVRLLGQEDLLQVEMATPPVFLPGTSYGQWSVGNPSPWGFKELDMTEQLTCHHIMDTISPRKKANQQKQRHKKLIDQLLWNVVTL